MTEAYVYPSAFIGRELARLPMTLRSLVNATITTKGGASSPFSMAGATEFPAALTGLRDCQPHTILVCER